MAKIPSPPKKNQTQVILPYVPLPLLGLQSHFCYKVQALHHCSPLQTCDPHHTMPAVSQRLGWNKVVQIGTKHIKCIQNGTKHFTLEAQTKLNEQCLSPVHAWCRDSINFLKILGIQVKPLFYKADAYSFILWN